MMMKNLKSIPEVIDRSQFIQRVLCLSSKSPSIAHSIPVNKLKLALEGGIMTYLLHCEARVTSFLGSGYYTIGPCGEELVGTTSLHLTADDLTAFHYRHLSNSIIIQLNKGRSLNEIALDRARGYVCSIKDPVTGGKHCCIGSIYPNREFIVTSTLASQAPGAVGRALAIPLASKLLGSQSNFASSAISYVSVGDGSINNAHFLSAINFAKYCEFRGIKCPIVFVVSDNNRCISLKGYDWINEFKKGFSAINSGSCGGDYIDNLQVADGNDIVDIYVKSKTVIDFTRQWSKPSMLIVNRLPRRFGHAATDRQFAYMTKEEIASQLSSNPLAVACGAAIASNIFTEKEFEDTFQRMVGIVEESFAAALKEEKINSRDVLVQSNSRPLVSPVKDRILTRPSPPVGNNNGQPGKAREPMRKHMTAVLEELLQANQECVYIGEDVEHGGYYLVTDGLAAKYPLRVRDFPPDETSLVGTGIGYSQAGLVPIVEIPYCKYLDCAYDLFNEAIMANWLSDGKQPNGMIIRLQGFDKGVFGGNFHTHNALPLPPGLDVVCFSNGEDYVRGMRFAYRQARAGRVIMFVDSTDLLNKRHLVDKERDELWLTTYPNRHDDSDEQQQGCELSFDSIVVYHPLPVESLLPTKANGFNIAIVSYGNGVPTSLGARAQYMRDNASSTSSPAVNISILDMPCISRVPSKLREYLVAQDYHAVIFADVCKYGAGMPLGGVAVDLQNGGVLKSKQWKIIGAVPTYNPLGTTLTFLNTTDVLSVIDELVDLHYKSCCAVDHS